MVGPIRIDFWKVTYWAYCGLRGQNARGQSKDRSSIHGLGVDIVSSGIVFHNILLLEFSSTLLGASSVVEFRLGNFHYCKELVRDCDYCYLHRSTHA